MLTATKDLMLPATVTGSWPRPRWYDGGLWGRPLDTALLDVKFREQFLDAHSTVIADQERYSNEFWIRGSRAAEIVASLSVSSFGACEPANCARPAIEPSTPSNSVFSSRCCWPAMADSAR